ncbi:MAG TPA: hypothetical protein VJY62_21310 [Bacteroidia bacterium]|nr:hypothetical protein [Bacteroidia bacterium]
MSDINKLILTSVLSFVAAWFLFNLGKNKEKKNKLFEIHGMLVENLNLIRYVWHYIECSYMMYAYHLQRMTLIKGNTLEMSNVHLLFYTAFDKDNINIEIISAKDDITFHMNELNKWRIMIISEKSKLEKYFYQINCYVDIMDLEADLKNIIEYEGVTEFSFKQEETLTKLLAVDVHDIQNKLEKQLKEKFNPISKKLADEIFKRIK